MTKLHILLIALLLSTTSFAATITPAEEGTPSEDNRIPPIEETSSPVKATTSSIDDCISPVDGSSHRGLFLLGNDVLDNIASRLSPKTYISEKVSKGVLLKGALQKKYLEAAIEGAKLTYTELEETVLRDVRNELHKLREIDNDKGFDTYKKSAARLESYLGEFIPLKHVQVAMNNAAMDMKQDEKLTEYNKNNRLALHVEKHLFITDPSKCEQAVTDANRQTWLMKAVVKNKVDALEALLQFPPSNLKSEIGTLLYAATRQHRLTLVEVLWKSVTNIPKKAFLSAMKGALTYFNGKRESVCLLFLMTFESREHITRGLVFPDIQPGSIQMPRRYSDKESSQLAYSVNRYLRMKGLHSFYRFHHDEGKIYVTLRPSQ